MDGLHSFFRLIVVGLVFIISLIIAATLVVASLIAISIAFLIAKIRGKQFEFKQHWKNRQQSPKWDFRKKQGFHIDKRSSDITDVDVNERH